VSGNAKMTSICVVEDDGLADSSVHGRGFWLFWVWYHKRGLRKGQKQARC
jgi:hypothetical protein